MPKNTKTKVNRRKQPNLGDNGVLICKKTIKSGDTSVLWDYSYIHAPSYTSTNYPDFETFSFGRAYEYIKLVKENNTVLIKTNDDRWMPFNMNYFNSYFRKFT